MNPATVLLGLILGTIFGPPIIEPKKYAETSTIIVKKTIKRIKLINSLLWLISFKKINAKVTYNKQIIFIIENADSFIIQIKIRIKQNIWSPNSEKFNRKTKRLIKPIKIKSYFLTWSLDNKKLLTSSFLFIKLLNSNILTISQLAKNKRIWEKIKKINLLELSIIMKMINITKDDNVLIKKEFISITTKPSFSINIIF